MDEESQSVFLKSTKSFWFYSIGLNRIVLVKDRQVQLEGVGRSRYRSKEHKCLACPERVFVNFQRHRECQTKCENFHKFKVHLLAVCAKYCRKLVFLDNECIPSLDSLKRERELTDMSPFLHCKFEVLNKQQQWVAMHARTAIRCELLNCEVPRCREMPHRSRSNYLLHIKSVEHKSGCYLIRKMISDQDQDQEETGFLNSTFLNSSLLEKGKQLFSTYEPVANCSGIQAGQTSTRNESRKPVESDPDSERTQKCIYQLEFNSIKMAEDLDLAGGDEDSYFWFLD